MCLVQRKFTVSLAMCSTASGANILRLLVRGVVSSSLRNPLLEFPNPLLINILYYPSMLTDDRSPDLKWQIIPRAPHQINQPRLTVSPSRR